MVSPRAARSWHIPDLQPLALGLWDMELNPQFVSNIGPFCFFWWCATILPIHEDFIPAVCGWGRFGGLGIVGFNVRVS